MCVGAATAHAQLIQKYLADESFTAAHVSVSIEGKVAPPQNWWARMWSYLGVRSNVRLRPKVGTTLRVVSSAYAPSPYQTDATPCITASGTTVRPGVVATNFLPLGTIIEIDGKKHIVEDRMNSRYDGYYMDVWFSSTSKALEFGRKKLEITIVGYGEPGDSIEEPISIPNSADVVQPKRTIWRSIADFLIAKTYSNPNRHDVDCST